MKNHKDDDKKDDKKDGDDKGDDDKKEEKKVHSQALAQFADVDKDGKISIYEYYLVTSFLQIKKQECQEFFKQNNLTELNKDTLKQFFDFIKKKAKVKLTMATVLDPRKFSVNKEMFKEHIDQCIKNLLEEKDTIPATKILQIRDDILKDIYKYQFDSFPVNEQGQISGEDFAKSLISYMEPKKCKQYMKHLNDVDFKGHFTFDEFYQFSKFLMDNQDKIEKNIEEKGYTNRKQFKKLIQEYQEQQKLKINIQSVDILIKVLDANGNNRIEPDEFKALVLDRPTYGGGEDTTLRKPYEQLVSLAKTWLNKAERIWDIIAE